MTFYDETNKQEIDEDDLDISSVVAQNATIQDYAQLLESGFDDPDDFYFWLNHRLFKSNKHYKLFEDVIEQELPANEVAETLDEAMGNIDSNVLLDYALDSNWLTKEDDQVA